jgi:hypothetical protein
MISKVQAEVAGQALLLHSTSQPKKSTFRRTKAAVGLLLGMMLGGVVGAGCGLWLTGRFTPG